MRKPLRSLVNAAVLGIITSSGAQAAGFSLYNEGSGAAVGNFGAGIAAEAADATTGWYNPAGLALVHDEQAIAGGVIVVPISKLSGTTTFAGLGPNPYTQRVNDLEGGKEAFVPSFHYARPLGENATFGFSVVAPFGLATDWGTKSALRYSATHSELITVNASPQIGGKITDNMSIGAGIDLQYADVIFNRILGDPTFPAGAPTQFDSESHNEGHSFGIGFHAGVLFMMNDNHTRIGLNYQSRMKHKFHGFSRLTGPLTTTGVFQTDNLFSNNIELPSITTLSAYHDVNEKFALLGSVVYTEWSVFKEIELNNVAFGLPGPTNLAVKSTAEQNYNNAWRFALGGNYKYRDDMMLRFGVGYDETPTNDRDRDVRLPDASRVAFAVGGHYDYSDKFAFDLGYTYLFAPKDAEVNKVEPAGANRTITTNVKGKPYAHLIGLQATWYIDGKPQKMLTK